MAPSPMFRALAALICLLLAHTIQAATIPPATYNPANIVDDIEKDCPVKNVPFDKSVFNAESLLTMPDVLKNGGVSKKCQDAALSDLVNCFSDGSIQIMTGCCSTICATAVKKNIQAGCFAEYQTAICSQPKAASVETGLFYAAKRCGNYAAACNGTTANSTAAKSNTTTPATAANSTGDSNTPPVVPAALATTGNRSTSSQTMAAAPTTSATASTAKSAASSTTVSTALSLAAVLMAFVFATVC